eukprot:752582-Hanusia_phi.AAC.2
MSTNAAESEDTVMSTIERKITSELKPVKLEVIPAYGDPNGSHVTINVVSQAFEGKRAVQRQQMVYKVIWEEMQGAIHAVDQMKCQTPAEAGMVHQATSNDNNPHPNLSSSSSMSTSPSSSDVAVTLSENNQFCFWISSLNKLILEEPEQCKE